MTPERFRSRITLATAVALHAILVAYKIELPNGDTLALPSFPLASQLEIDGDPVDLGAKAQRMVRAHLERYSVEAADTADSSLE